MVSTVSTQKARAVELLSVPNQDAVRAKSGGGETATEASVDGGQGFLQIIAGGELAWYVSAGNQVIDVFQESFHAGVEFIEVSDNRNVRRPRPSGGLRCRGGVVAVDVKSAGIDDPVALKLLGTKREAVVASPKDSALAGVVDEDERLLAGTA